MKTDTAHAEQHTAIAEELAQIGSAFEPDELAYLALTIKVENQIRNRLAWRLHQRFSPQGLIAARDWVRGDLAIMDSGARPLTTIQAGAVHESDVRSDLNWRAYATRVQADTRKTRKMVGQDGQVLLLAVGVAVQGDVERSLRSVLKHNPASGKAAELGGRKRIEAIAGRLGDLGPVQSFRVGEGQAFKLQVAVDAFLVGPL